MVCKGKAAAQKTKHPTGPVVCLDERPTQLIAETRKPNPVAPGQSQRYDYERAGTANNFMVTESLGCWRKVNVRATKIALDFCRAGVPFCSGARYPIRDR